MINFFKHVPVQFEELSFEKVHHVSKWNIPIYKGTRELTPTYNVVLLDKDLHERLSKFLKPIDGMYELQKLGDKFQADLRLPAREELDSGDLKPAKIPHKYRELHDYVVEQWNDRFKYNPSTLFQFNAVAKPFRREKNRYMRRVAVHSDYYIKDSPNNQTKLERISYSRFFLIYFGARIYCTLNNLFYRREIKEDKEQQYFDFRQGMRKIYAKIRRAKGRDSRGCEEFTE